MIRLLRRTNNESGITIEFLVEGICIGHDPYTVDLYFDLSLAEDERVLFVSSGIHSLLYASGIFNVCSSDVLVTDQASNDGCRLLSRHIQEATDPQQETSN